MGRARMWEAVAWVLIGWTMAMLSVATVTGSSLPVLPAMIATVLGLLAGRRSDQLRRRL